MVIKLDKKEFTHNLRVSEHSFEPVEEINGIIFINDSKSTDIKKTLESLQQMNSPTILIIGGRDEATDYSYLSEVSTDILKTVIYTGNDATKINRQFIRHSKVDFVHISGDLKKCLQYSLTNGNTGFVVLYSPACPSFDIFDNYKNRGNQFKLLVKKLKIE